MQMASNIHAQNRVYRPQDLLAISRAFDEAWASVADSFKGYEERIEAARTRLADAVLEAAAGGVKKVEALKIIALVEFTDERERRGMLPKVTIAQ
jgi:hypothetical protein